MILKRGRAVARQASGLTCLHVQENILPCWFPGWFRGRKREHGPRKFERSNLE